MSYETRKLLAAYEEHGKIIVGCDFDDTFFALSEDITVRARCAQVRELLRPLEGRMNLCLYTVTDEQSLKYKLAIMTLHGLSPQYINESPIKMGNGAKPFFNILLDDKAGLDQAIEILTEFKKELKL